jgi:uncharacterized protein
MEIEQSFSVAYPLDEVWASFHDTSGIVACLPGASLAAPPENGQLKLAMTVKLGPIVANFAGDGEMTLDEAAKRGSVSGGGVDRKSSSRVKGVAAFALHATAASETRVDVTVDYAIAGTLAQFSRGGIVKELATRMTEAFAQNLKTKLDAQSALNVPNALNAQQQNVTAEQNVAAEAPANIPASAAQQQSLEFGSAAAATQPARPDAQPASQSQPGELAATQEPPQNEQAARVSSVTPAPPVTRAAPTAFATAPTPRAHPASPAQPPQNAPLDLGNLFWKMLWSRVRGWLRLDANSR